MREDGLVRRLWDKLAQHWCNGAGRHSFWSELAHGLPVGVVMLAVSVLCEHAGMLDSFDAAVIRWVEAHRALSDPTLSNSGMLTIQQFEISAEERVAHFERPGLVSTREIETAGGVMPIDRETMAAYLRNLADMLPVRTDAVPVVAIDVDLAPLANAATEPSMIRALTALRQRADVIVIVMPRADPRARAVRNAFMRNAGCTRLFTEPGTSMGQRAAPYGLYFASPRLFYRPGEFPARFPYRLKHEAAHEALPPAFPSLGTLMALRHQLNHVDAAPPDNWFHALYAGVRHVPKGDGQQILTTLCEQAIAATAQGNLLEDGLSPEQDDPAAARPLDVLRVYDTLPFNWRLLESTQLRYTLLPGVTELAQLRQCSAEQPAPGQPEDARDCADLRLRKNDFKAPVLLLGIDGGDRHDKFDVAAHATEPVSGATLHGLQALSVEKPLSENPWLGLLLDVAVGLAFLMAWSALGPLLKAWADAMPKVGGWALAGAPALLALVLMFACVWVAVVFTEIDFWLNPAYLILGLWLDTYFEGWRHAEGVKTKGHGVHGPDWSFGARAVLTAWPRPAPMPANGASHAAASPTGAEPAPGAALADALVAALFQWTVLLVGGAVLAHKLWKG